MLMLKISTIQSLVERVLQLSESDYFHNDFKVLLKEMVYINKDRRGRPTV